MTRVVRFGPGTLAELPAVLTEIGVERAALVTTARGARDAGALPVVGIYDAVRRHVPVETVAEAAALVERLDADGLVALGGGSAIDTAKAVVAELARRSRIPLPRIVAVPTTYAGAEWTHYFGLLLEPGRKGGGADERAIPVAAIYDPELTLDLPCSETVGTALNALAHCAEAYYAPDTTEQACREADAGAAVISRWLPAVVAEPSSLERRAGLLEGAMHAALALADSGLCLAHAMAQALGGRYGISHCAMNAICLPAALRFNRPTVPDSIARLERALGTSDGPARVEELARLGGFERLRDFGVSEADLVDVAELVIARPGARANPRPAGVADVLALLREVW